MRDGNLYYGEPVLEVLKRQKSQGHQLSVVIPVKDRCDSTIRNCLKSLELQDIQCEVIIVDYWSQEHNHHRLMEVLAPFDCTVFYFHRTDSEAIWKPCEARNIGIRRAGGDIIVAVDADGILERKLLSTLMEIYSENHNAWVYSSTHRLPRSDWDKLELPKDYKFLRSQPIHLMYTCGALLSAPKNWWWKVQGFDERIEGWGPEDIDISRRAKLDGRTTVDIHELALDETRIYHQWHPRSEIFYANNRTNWSYVNDRRVIKNDQNWGVGNLKASE